MSRKSWRFVKNNYTQEHIDHLNRISEECSKMVVSAEVGEGGTPHLQGHVTFRSTHRLSSLNKIFDKFHWIIPESNDSIYELKHDSVILIDVNNSKQGKRTDLEQIRDDIIAGATDSELFMNYTSSMVRYTRGIREMRSALLQRNEKSNFTLADFPWTKLDLSRSHILMGPAGIGKTEFALAHFKRPFFCSDMDDLKEFNSSYDGIVFDDMSFIHIPRTAQIHLVDMERNRSIRIRYGLAHIPKGIPRIFTCNVECFDIMDSAIARRIFVTKVTER